MSPTKHKLALEANAFDSLNEGLRKYRAGKEGESGAYKFAVQHIAHFMELYFKFQVTKRHALLLYKNPFAKIGDGSSTIGLWEAVQFLQNDGAVLPAGLPADLRWFKDLRNRIEHSAFELDATEVRQAIGRLVRATEEFARSQKIQPVRLAVADDLKPIYDILSDEYAHEVDEARQSVKEEGEEPRECAICWLEDVAFETENGVQCRFCDELDEWEVCCLCGETFRRSATLSWNDDVDPPDRICEDCHTGVMVRMGIE